MARNTLKRNRRTIIAGCTALIVSALVYNACEDDIDAIVHPLQYEQLYYDVEGNIHSVITGDEDIGTPPDMRNPKKLKKAGSTDMQDAPPLQAVIDCDTFVEIDEPYFLTVANGAGNLYSSHNVNLGLGVIRVGGVRDTFLLDSVWVDTLTEIVVGVLKDYYTAQGQDFDSVRVYDKTVYDPQNEILVPDFHLMLWGSTLESIEVPSVRMEFPDFTPLPLIINLFKANRAVSNAFIGADTLAPIFSDFISLDYFTLWAHIDSAAAGDAIQVLIDTCKTDIFIGALNGVPVDSAQYQYLQDHVQVLID